MRNEQVFKGIKYPKRLRQNNSTKQFEFRKSKEDKWEIGVNIDFYLSLIGKGLYSHNDKKSNVEYTIYDLNK